MQVLSIKRRGPVWGKLWMKCMILACGQLWAISVWCSEVEPPKQQIFIEWAAEQAVVVEDLYSTFPDDCSSAFQQARVVGLGESRHDTREQCLFKSLLTKRLIEDFGYRIFLLEESFCHAEPLDHFVATGQGDLPELMNGLAGWYLWDTVEMQELILWIRHFNEGQKPGQKCRIFGMDITAPALGVRSVLDLLVASGVETSLDAKALGLDLQQGDMWPTTWQRYGDLSSERRDELGHNYSILVHTIEREQERIVALSSNEDYERAQLLGEIGQMGNNLFSSSNRGDGGLVREEGMAQVAFWILEQEMPNEKAIIWAHNLHVAKSPFKAPGFAEGELEPMGMLFQEKFGERYLAIGGAFGKGAFPPGIPPGEREFLVVSPEVLDGALAEVGIPNFLLDLRLVPKSSKASGWLQVERGCRAQGIQAVMVPGTAFDMLYFVGTISRAEPTRLALRRYESLSN